ncbi:MAG: hypothetical protein D6744_02175 [Planctomycetota bacterium]|nr:MAG: hypothetical protein D6744_02175 [Planctomycetota bacterium]
MLPPPPPELFDETGRIAQDVQCRRCSYNLRGLSGDGRCPECGTPVGRSTHGDLLRYSDPDWVQALELGVRLILLGIVANLLAGVIGAVLNAFFHPLIGGLVQLAGSAVGFYGTWLLTEPDPSGIGEDVYGRARKVTRFAMLVGVIGQVASMLQRVVVLSNAVLLLLIPVAIVAALIGVVGFWYQLFYIEKLAERVPQEDVVRRARFLRWAYPISTGGVILGGVLATLYVLVTGPAAPWTPGGGPPPGGAAPAGGLVAASCVVTIFGLATLVFGVMYLVMLFKLRRALKDQLATSRMIWSAAAA